jgi:carbamoyltransferase
VNKWLNDQLHRTEFMPFAPAAMYESASEYFQDIEGAEYAAEFMTITFDCTEKARREIPAAVHVDNTARPQLVHRDRNPRFYNILRAYREMTGVPVVINTSFNMHEEPIVASPYDAIRCFQLGHLDVLVLGNYVIEAEKK